jgi:hypothetical protein
VELQGQEAGSEENLVWPRRLEHARSDEMSHKGVVRKEIVSDQLAKERDNLLAFLKVKQKERDLIRGGYA